MATRETKLARGRSRGRSVSEYLIRELIVARQTHNVSQRALAQAAGRSQSQLWRIEHRIGIDTISIVEIAEYASLLGMEIGAGLHPVGDPLRDKGHVALINRFRSALSPAFRAQVEGPFPAPGDRRSWDVLLRIDDMLVGVEAETRIRDQQRLIRRVRERERDGGVDEILVLLAESRINRALLRELVEALGPRYSTPARVLMRSLRGGHRLTGSGVILM